MPSGQGALSSSPLSVDHPGRALFLNAVQPGHFDTKQTLCQAKRRRPSQHPVEFQELPGLGGFGLVEHLLCLPALQQPSLVEEQRLVGDTPGLLQGVGH